MATLQNIANIRRIDYDQDVDGNVTSIKINAECNYSDFGVDKTIEAIGLLTATDLKNLKSIVAKLTNLDNLKLIAEG